MYLISPRPAPEPSAALGKQVKTYKRKHGAAGEKPRAQEAGPNEEDQDTFNEGEISMRVSNPSIPEQLVFWFCFQLMFLWHSLFMKIVLIHFISTCLCKKLSRRSPRGPRGRKCRRADLSGNVRPVQETHRKALRSPPVRAVGLLPNTVLLSMYNPWLEQSPLCYDDSRTSGGWEGTAWGWKKEPARGRVMPCFRWRKLLQWSLKTLQTISYSYCN